jgi:hypothetical protein
MVSVDNNLSVVSRPYETRKHPTHSAQSSPAAADPMRTTAVGKPDMTGGGEAR